MNTQKQTSDSYTDYWTPAQPEQRDTAQPDAMVDSMDTQLNYWRGLAERFEIKAREATEAFNALHGERNDLARGKADCEQQLSATTKTLAETRAHAERLAEALRKVLDCGSLDLNGLHKFSHEFQKAKLALAAWEANQ
jgi:septal ring factor EnvC (AmiA/AmiB activator)